MSRENGPRLLFVVPVHGREELAGASLTALAWACRELEQRFDRVSVIVAGEGKLLAVARALGFGTVESENEPLGRKWNDAYELATNPELNPSPADYVIPFGSDDLVDPELLLSAPLPDDHEITCFQRCAFVSEKGDRIARAKIRYPGGVGIRVFPWGMLERAGFRPMAEEARRACDTSTLHRLRRLAGRPKFLTFDLHPLQLVDFKTARRQLNDYRACRAYRVDELEHPFDELQAAYPSEIVELFRRVYGRSRELVSS